MKTSRPPPGFWSTFPTPYASTLLFTLTFYLSPPGLIILNSSCSLLHLRNGGDDLQLVFPRENYFVIPEKAGMQMQFPGNSRDPALRRRRHTTSLYSWSPSHGTKTIIKNSTTINCGCYSDVQYNTKIVQKSTKRRPRHRSPTDFESILVSLSAAKVSAAAAAFFAIIVVRPAGRRKVRRGSRL
jgi:hypothetical protein